MEITPFAPTRPSSLQRNEKSTSENSSTGQKTTQQSRDPASTLEMLAETLSEDDLPSPVTVHPPPNRAAAARTQALAGNAPENDDLTNTLFKLNASLSRFSGSLATDKRREEANLARDGEADAKSDEQQGAEGDAAFTQWVRDARAAVRTLIGERDPSGDSSPRFSAQGEKKGDAPFSEFGAWASQIRQLLDKIMETKLADSSALDKLLRMMAELTQKLNDLARKQEQDAAKKELAAAVSAAVVGIVSSAVSTASNVNVTVKNIKLTQRMHNKQTAHREAARKARMEGSVPTGNPQRDRNNSLHAERVAEQHDTQVRNYDFAIQEANHRLQMHTALIRSAETVVNRIGDINKAEQTKQARLLDSQARETTFNLNAAMDTLKELLRTIQKIMDSLMQLLNQVRSSQEKLTARGS